MVSFAADESERGMASFKRCRERLSLGTIVGWRKAVGDDENLIAKTW